MLINVMLIKKHVNVDARSNHPEVMNKGCKGFGKESKVSMQ